MEKREHIILKTVGLNIGDFIYNFSYRLLETKTNL